jgi:hypothetical protein
MYRVIKYFTDLQDNDFAYDVNDEYPRKGLIVSPSRIRELASDKNRQGVPLIEEKPEKKTKSTKKVDKE